MSSILDEEWFANGRHLRHGPPSIGMGENLPGVVFANFDEADRCQLAALAPKMAKFLLAHEWLGPCQVCGGIEEAGHEPYGDDETPCEYGELCDKIRKIVSSAEAPGRSPR